MKRGELYRVYKGAKYDPRDHRVFLIVGRQQAIESGFSSVICAPVYSNYTEFTTQVEIGVDEGLKHDSAVYCDELISVPKSVLTDYIGSLSPCKMEEVNAALRIALALN
ncbi:MAG: type II toxin-antitoxin system PemK/MazF family toxin [Spirochaetaceae bacterium]|jgi:mRNA interferase MazF|nr:type II toxin-antitoxin system PemK/MazF family toxin [Spirochaetaceae bacterium]